MWAPDSHFPLRRRTERSTMYNSVDLYLGAFLILCGFSLSILNLRRVIKKNKFSSVLLSENILLTCIGVTFIARAAYQYNVENVHMSEMDERASTARDESKQCNIWSAIMSYGPLVVSFVNSFLTLVIDNYLHYNMLRDMKEKEDEDTIRDVEDRTIERKLDIKKVLIFWKRYFSQIVIGLQWIVPIFIGLFMYPMGVHEKILPAAAARGDTCMAMINLSNETCETQETNYTNIVSELRRHVPPPSYLEAYDNYEDDTFRNKSKEINIVLKNLYGIINDIQNNSFGHVNVTSASIFRRPKSNSHCMKVCYIENSKLLLYMFSLAIVSYFVPITISTIILTKIYMMDTRKVNEKTYASRELLYNVLFWTPVMLDTFLSLIMCTYSMNGMKTSLINTIANVYQAVKNFMNTKYFKDNAITPI